MATPTLSPPSAEAETRDSWVPMVVIAMGQMLMSFNVAAIPVSMGGMVESFGTPPTTVATAIVLYSLGVSGFILLGAKLGQRFGSKIFFQAAVALFVTGPAERTLPRQMFNGIRENISPVIAAAATMVIFLSVLLLMVLEILRRRSERLRGIRR